MDIELIRQAIAQMGPVQIGARRKIDSLKNQGEMLKACKAKDLSALGALIGLGMDPNFTALSEGYQRSPLSQCAANSWEEGARLLIQAGATDQKIDLEAIGPENALRLAAYAGKAGPFKQMWLAHPDPAFRQQAIEIDRVRGKNPEITLALLELGYFEGPAGKATGAQWVAEHCRLLRNQGREHEEALITWIQRKGSGGLGELSGALWKSALQHDRLTLARELAKAQITPPEWRISVQSGDIHPRRRASPAEWLPPEAQDSANGYLHVAIPEGKAAMSLLGYCAMVGARDCAQAFLGIPELLRQFGEDSAGIGALALRADPEMLKSFKAAGFPMELARDTDGATPLHAAFSRRALISKTALKDLASIHPGWVAMKDQAGREPLNFLKMARSEYAPLLESLLIKRDNPTPRGAKAALPAARKPRL